MKGPTEGATTGEWNAAATGSRCVLRPAAAKALLGLLDGCDRPGDDDLLGVVVVRDHGVAARQQRLDLVERRRHGRHPARRALGSGAGHEARHRVAERP